MSPLDLSIQGPTAWIQLIAGTALYLAPGFLAALRYLPKSPLGLMLGPVFSVSLMTVSGIVLDLVFGAPVNTVVTMFTALAWTAWFGRHWKTWGWVMSINKRLWLPLLMIIPLVALVQALPHIPGEDGDAWDAYPRLAGRAVDGLTGEDYPYPIHVDEYIRMAQMSDMIEEGTMDIGDPYTGDPSSGSLFSVSGLRAERGFAFAMAQIHLLTGAALPTIARFLPAIWAGYTGGVVYAALSPAPGAALAGAGSVILPNTARFLGSGFLVPSNFALPWIFAVILIIRETPRDRLLAAQWLVATAAFSLHIVQGTLTLAAMILMHVFKGDGGNKVAGALAATVPLVWLLPPLWADAKVAVATEHTLPFEENIFRLPGVAIYGLAAAGLALAFIRDKKRMAAHRTLAILTVALAISMIWSIQVEHQNEATYTRIFFAFLLCLTSLTALALGEATITLRAKVAGPAPKAAISMATILVAAILVAPAIDQNLNTPIYHIHNDSSWAASAAFVALNPKEDSIYLTEPWQAPTSTFGTQARPWSVLYPGQPPVHAADYTHYVSTNGADEEWLDERNIEWIIGPIKPKAPHLERAPNVWQLI